MAEYVCSVCGFIYDEAKGSPEGGISPGTVWDDLPGNWGCPLCGAEKSEFSKQGEVVPSEAKQQSSADAPPIDQNDLSVLELSAVCTNLARGCEKQYKPEEAALFTGLAEYFQAAAAVVSQPDLDDLIALIEEDLAKGYPQANAFAAEAKDRGALRALVWSEKVTKSLNTLIARYQREGDAFLENADVFVCPTCGFFYLGEAPPDVCPVCKVPNWKFEKIEGRG